MLQQSKLTPQQAALNNLPARSVVCRCHCHRHLPTCRTASIEYEHVINEKPEDRGTNMSMAMLSRTFKARVHAHLGTRQLGKVRRIPPSACTLSYCCNIRGVWHIPTSLTWLEPYLHPVSTFLAHAFRHTASSASCY